MTENQFHIDLSSTKIAGTHAGEGPPLVFLHASVADRRMWRLQIDALRHKHQVITYDRRGFGETTAIDEPFSHVDDLQAVLAHFDLEKATLVGCSQGGRIAIDFALAYPGRVASLALISSAVSGAPGPGELPPQVQALDEALDAADEEDDLERINEIETHMWLDGPLCEEGRVQGELRQLFLNMNGIALQMPDLDQEIEPASAYERVSELTMPTLIIWGALDFPHVKKRCRYLVESISGASGEELADAAHLVSYEKAEEINRLLSKLVN